MWARYSNGATLEEIGAAYGGLTRERIRQRLQAYVGQDALNLVKRARKEEAEAARRAVALKRELERESAKVPAKCKVCGTPFKAGKARPNTCSSPCSKVWNYRSARQIVDPVEHARHRMLRERWLIEHPEAGTPEQVEHAKHAVKVYDETGVAPPSSRRYVLKGSKAYRLLVAALGETRADEVIARNAAMARLQMGRDEVSTSA